jgi:hypothetical protein
MQKLVLKPQDTNRIKEEEIEDPAIELLNNWVDRLFNKSGYNRNRYIKKTLESEEILFNLLQKKVYNKNLPGDFKTVVSAYPRAALLNDTKCLRNIECWLKGESTPVSIPTSYSLSPGRKISFPGTSAAFSKPVVIKPIMTASSLDVFRGLLWLLKECGYKGLILSIDEVEQLARLKPSMRIQRALQMLREFVDNTDGDIGLKNLIIYFAATPVMFDGEDYFPKYEALRTRIEPVSENINWRSPVINLEKTMLGSEQLTVIAIKIRDIYNIAYYIKENIMPDAEIKETVKEIEHSPYRIAKPRLLCRVMTDQLERKRQGTTLKIDNVLSSAAKYIQQENE